MLSRRTDYALRCLVYLAQQPESKLVSTAELSRELKVSRVFLSKIFQELSRKRIVISEKGKGGGVRLRDRTLSLWRVIRALEPGFCLNLCLNGKHRCFLSGQCPLHRVLGKLQRKLEHELDRTELGQLSFGRH